MKKPLVIVPGGLNTDIIGLREMPDLPPIIVPPAELESQAHPRLILT